MSYLVITESESRHLRYFASLKGNQGHLTEGLFIAESPKIVEQVLRSSLKIRTAYLTPEFLDRYQRQFALRPEQIEVVVAPKARMELIVGYALHQGLMLTVEIPTAPSLIEILKITKHPSTIVALDAIADAENIGTIIRTCAAFGVTAIVLDDQSCNPYLRRSVRVSMGTIVNATLIQVPSLAPELRLAKDSGSMIVGATLGKGSVALERVNLAGDVVLVFGSEGLGISESVLKICDQLVEIPIENGIDSLNVGVACGIFLNQIRMLRSAR